jgi:hypothetical protein
MFPAIWFGILIRIENVCKIYQVVELEHEANPVVWFQKPELKELLRCSGVNAYKLKGFCINILSFLLILQLSIFTARFFGPYLTTSLIYLVDAEFGLLSVRLSAHLDFFQRSISLYFPTSQCTSKVKHSLLLSFVNKLR